MKHLLFTIFLFAVLSAKSQSDTSGTYQPVITESVNLSGIIAAGPAHFICTDSVCVVYGRVNADGINSVGAWTYYTLSLPVLTHLTGPDDAVGLLNVLQGNHSVGAVGWVSTFPAGTVFFFWIPTITGRVNTFYTYSFIRK